MSVSSVMICGRSSAYIQRVSRRSSIPFLDSEKLQRWDTRGKYWLHRLHDRRALREDHFDAFDACATEISLQSSSYLCNKHEANLRLTSIHRIKSLIHEQSHCPARIHPRRTICIQCRTIPQQRQDIDDYEAESQQSDQVGCHPHGKTFYDKVRVEGFEDVARKEGVVDAIVFVLFEIGEFLLSDVDHLLIATAATDVKLENVCYREKDQVAGIGIGAFRCCWWFI